MAGDVQFTDKCVVIMSCSKILVLNLLSVTLLGTWILWCLQAVVCLLVTLRCIIIYGIFSVAIIAQNLW